MIRRDKLAACLGFMATLFGGVSAEATPAGSRSVSAPTSIEESFLEAFQVTGDTACIESAIDAVLFSDREPTREEAEAAVRRAVRTFHSRVAVGGGYVWRVSGDMTMREGEGVAGESLIWMQPPGTPSVGEAFLDAYETTGDTACIAAALDAGRALLKGQMRSGGWDHFVETDPVKRTEFGYRDVPGTSPAVTSLDDDITQSAVRFLMRLDKDLRFKDPAIHEGTLFCLQSILAAQRPNGGWYPWWKEYPTAAPAPPESPALHASFPDSWPRKWPNDWTAVYYINDRVIPNVIVSMVMAWEIYKDDAYFEAARRGGEFLLLAQMPAPQPAWAQQYDVEMHPVWDREFEPPAISGLESQDVLDTLLFLYRKTGDRRFLEPIPRALDYLRRSLLPDGRLARFYELQTNEPLYFRRNGDIYFLTYSPDHLPTHYGFIVDSRLDDLEAEYRRLLTDGFDPSDQPVRNVPYSMDIPWLARQVIDAADEDGLWVTKGRMEGFGKVVPRTGLLESATFIRNISILCDYIRSRK
jgi:hypothetical protein